MTWGFGMYIQIICIRIYKYCVIEVAAFEIYYAFDSNRLCKNVSTLDSNENKKKIRMMSCVDLINVRLIFDAIHFI